MTRARLPEAERLRRHNEEMRFAMEHNLSLADARYQLFQERMRRMDAARDERVAARVDERRGRRNERLCGTSAGEAGSEGPHYWWDRD